MQNDSVILYIILRDSLQLNNDQLMHCVADAVQLILIKYFTLQVLAVKTHLNSLENDNRLTTTKKWLASHSHKMIIPVNDDTWDKLKSDFSVGKDLFTVVADAKDGVEESALVFWPLNSSDLPSYI